MSPEEINNNKCHHTSLCAQLLPVLLFVCICSYDALYSYYHHDLLLALPSSINMSQIASISIGPGMQTVGVGSVREAIFVFIVVRTCSGCRDYATSNAVL